MELNLSRRSLITGVASLLSVTPMVAEAAEKDSLLGAGGSTIRPIMAGWVEQQKKTINLNITYQAIGSPAGTTKIPAGDADFAVLEIPLSDMQLLGSHLYQFPLAFAEVVFVVNLHGVGSTKLQLNGPSLAVI